MKIVFLCSGGGGNLRFLDLVSSAMPMPIEVRGVLVDRPCPAEQYAVSRGLPCGRYRFDGTDDEEALAEIDGWAPDFIVTNIHRILSPQWVVRHGSRLLNLHYSLLPAFAGSIGAAPVQAALDAGCRFIGTTFHRVEEQVDAGAIVCQSVLEVERDEEFSSLMERVFRSGCVNLLNGLCVAAGESTTARGDLGGARFSPWGLEGLPLDFDEAFWAKVRG
ncbi:formyltransferase family protein [Phycisphaerales bacterium]|nr:formyltransferase family protein [Phycisphaerales bacterium]RPG15003.1 MAG: hypothetical protein CBB69_010585 [Phycisphaera sp. TMED9]